MKEPSPSSDAEDYNKACHKIYCCPQEMWDSDFIFRPVNMTGCNNNHEKGAFILTP